MIFLPLLLGFAGQSGDVPGVITGYRVFAFRYQGRCGYAVTHIAGLTAKQVKQTLSDSSYIRAAGIQIVTDPDTPKRCIAKVRQVTSRLRFEKVATRLRGEDGRPSGPSQAPPNGQPAK